MSKSSISITFQDTLSVEPTAVEIDNVIASLSQQLIAAADKVRANPKAIHAYLAVTQPWVPETVKTDDAPVKSKTKPIVELETANPADLLVLRVFENLKHTEKSERIIRAFANNSGNDMSIAQLVNDTGLTKNDVSAWLNQTGKKVKSVTNPSRGIYNFDPDKL